VWERIATPEGLAGWFAASSLGVGRLAVDADDVAAAIELRRALWALAHAASDGEALPPGALTVLNAHAARPGLRPRLLAVGEREWAEPTAAAALATIAAEGVELLSGRQAGRVRRCEGERCYLLFVDTSPPGRRRWCSMERCGNRHKVRAHRAGA
jgi:predicted RNA-binding Zn ribbon-like protein